MDSHLKQTIDEYISAFFEQEVYKKYKVLEKELNSNPEILTLKENLKKAQKALALSINDIKEHQKNKVLFEKAQKEYNEHPIVLNYSTYKEALIQQITELKYELEEID